MLNALTRVAWLCLFMLVNTTGSSQPKKVKATKPPPIAQSIAAGKIIYTTYCVSCHQPDGGGMPNMNPPLGKTSFVLGEKPVLITILLKGMSHQEVDGESYHNVMPPFDFLTDKEIADVLTFVRNTFGNTATAISIEDVKQTRPK